MFRLHDFQIPHLAEQIADLLKICRVTITLAHRPVVVLAGQVQFIGALLDHNARDVIDRQVGQQFFSGAAFAGGLIGGGVAPADIEAQNADHRPEENQSANLFAVHLDVVRLRL